MTTSDYLLLYTIIGTCVGAALIYIGLSKGHIKIDDKYWDYVCLSIGVSVFVWPLIIALIIYMVRTHIKEEESNE